MLLYLKLISFTYIIKFILIFFILVHRSTKLGLEQYKTFLDELAKNKKVELTEIKKKMANCGPPGVTAGASGVRIKFIYLTLHFNSTEFDV